MLSNYANLSLPAHGFQVAVVGAGIIGLAVAYHLVDSGLSVVVIDREPGGDSASIGNAGAIAVTEVFPASAPGMLRRIPGWLLDPLGPLAIRPTHALKLVPWLARFVKAGKPEEVARISRALAAINSRVYEDLLPMLRNTGLSGVLRRHGALTVYETESGFRLDEAEWASKRALGVIAEDLTALDARTLEPALGSLVCRAIFTPDWSYVSDPREVLDGIRNWLLNRGVLVRQGEVCGFDVHCPRAPAIRLKNGKNIYAENIVIAAGTWSALLAGQLGDRALLESERGYNTTVRDPGISLSHQLIFAERKFVATPLTCGLRVGGAAEFGGLDAPPNFQRSRVLAQLAKKYLPQLRLDGDSHYWAGHRPTTPDSLPVISRSAHYHNVFYAFGHGHLGLTQAATTGRLVCDLLLKIKSAIDLAPYEISRFE
jgi:D-amino-acid dehydrogenase